MIIRAYSLGPEYQSPVFFHKLGKGPSGGKIIAKTRKGDTIACMQVPN